MAVGPEFSSVRSCPDSPIDVEPSLWRHGSSHYMREVKEKVAETVQVSCERSRSMLKRCGPSSRPVLTRECGLPQITVDFLGRRADLLPPCASRKVLLAVHLRVSRNDGCDPEALSREYQPAIWKHYLRAEEQGWVSKVRCGMDLVRRKSYTAARQT